MSRTRSQYVSPIGVLTATNFITSGVATITNTRGSNANYSGIVTANNVVIGAAQTSLVVLGDARITGILTVGTATITFDGNNNRINVGSGITFNGSTGIISATEFRGNGANLTGVQPFPVGTLMLFQQTSAPTGWTKQTTHNNKALRCVSGSAGSGGSVGFTTAFTSRSGVGTVAATTLTTSQIPSHTHPLSRQSGNNNINSQSSRYALATDNNLGIDNTAGAGGGGSHTHGFDLTMNFDVQYVDLIIAAKD